MKDDNWTRGADRDQRRDRKRVQNREAQRTYRNRMKQRVEDLEKQVDTYRYQAQARGLQASGEAGEGQDETSGDAMISNDSATVEVGKGVSGGHENVAGVMNTIKVSDERQNNRKRPRPSNSDSHGKPETSNEESSMERDEPASTQSPLPPPSSSQLRFPTQTAALHTQEKSPTPQHQVSFQGRDAGTTRSQPQGIQSLLAEDFPQEPGQPLLSPNNTTGPYINPNLLSQASFAPPYFSPPMQNLGAYPPSLLGFPYPSLNTHGQYSQEWSWPHTVSNAENRRGTYGQDVPVPDPEPNSPHPAAADLYSINKVLSNHPSHPRASPRNAARMNQSSDAGFCEQIPLDEGRDLDLDHETASTAADKTTEPGTMTDASSPCLSDFVETLIGKLPFGNTEQMRELPRILEEILDRIRSNDSDSMNNSTNVKNDHSLGARKASGASKQGTCKLSQEDRFEFVQWCLAAVDFSSIDAMVGEYYAADFRHDSPIARQQRISRRTKLTGLIEQLRDSSQNWTQWEAHGYQSQIMLSAMSLIDDERREFVASRDLFIDALAELPTVLSGGATISGGGSTGRRPRSLSSSKAFQRLMKVIQDKMPKLWSLTEDLGNENDLGNQGQRLYTSLAIVLLLSRAPRLPSSEVNALAIGCLSVAEDT